MAIMIRLIDRKYFSNIQNGDVIYLSNCWKNEPLKKLIVHSKTTKSVMAGHYKFLFSSSDGTDQTNNYQIFKSEEEISSFKLCSDIMKKIKGIETVPCHLGVEKLEFIYQLLSSNTKLEFKQNLNKFASKNESY